jgi:hypothetical protein
MRLQVSRKRNGLTPGTRFAAYFPVRPFLYKASQPPSHDIMIIGQQNAKLAHV